jgi:ataxia telangiectasia mutated family protein
MTHCILGALHANLSTISNNNMNDRSAAPVKIKHVQGTADADIDGMGLDSAEAEAADRALSSVARKLDTSMSVEYTVNDLIATATDPVNLSQLFVGT